MHDGIPYDPIQGQLGQVHVALKKFEIQTFSKSVSSAIFHGSWEMTDDS